MDHASIPRDRENDYTDQNAVKRGDFVRERTGAQLAYVAKYSFDPAIVAGNMENFIGVAQVSIGIAGPLRINGEHARGDFIIPMATTEGRWSPAITAACASSRRAAASRPRSPKNICSARRSCAVPLYSSRYNRPRRRDRRARSGERVR